MPFDIEAFYSESLYRSWAAELILRAQQNCGFKLNKGHALEIVAAHLGYASEAAHIASGLYQIDRLPEWPDVAYALSSDWTARHGLAEYCDELSRCLDILIYEEMDPRISLAKRLVRSVNYCCRDTQGLLCGSVQLKPVDVGQCLAAIESAEFRDFLFDGATYPASQVFGFAQLQTPQHGHLGVDGDAALNVAAFLHQPALDLLIR